MTRIHSFTPVESASATILILGSMPGKESLRAVEYYAHPRNAFWRIMGELIGASPELPYDTRIQLLKASNIALWDVLASCSRSTSLDADIVADSITPNDFSSFFLNHPHITHVFFNGAKAEQCFLKHVRPSLNIEHLHYQRLPSTSPAHAAITYVEKLKIWRAIQSLA